LLTAGATPLFTSPKQQISFSTTLVDVVLCLFSFVRIITRFTFWSFSLTFCLLTTDPVERLKNVVTFAISGLSNTCTQKKPFNPILGKIHFKKLLSFIHLLTCSYLFFLIFLKIKLGETFQAAFEDGSQVFTEQSSHHPPVTNWQIFGPDGLYHFYGYGEWTASFRGNSVKG